VKTREKLRQISQYQQWRLEDESKPAYKKREEKLLEELLKQEKMLNQPPKKQRFPTGRQ